MSSIQKDESFESEDVVCPGFQPRPWRSNRCRHCYRLKNEHGDRKAPDPNATQFSPKEFEERDNRRQASRLKFQESDKSSPSAPHRSGHFDLSESDTIGEVGGDKTGTGASFTSKNSSSDKEKKLRYYSGSKNSGDDKSLSITVLPTVRDVKPSGGGKPELSDPQGSKFNAKTNYSTGGSQSRNSSRTKSDNSNVSKTTVNIDTKQQCSETKPKDSRLNIPSAFRNLGKSKESACEKDTQPKTPTITAKHKSPSPSRDVAASRKSPSKDVEQKSPPGRAGAAGAAVMPNSRQVDSSFRNKNASSKDTKPRLRRSPSPTQISRDNESKTGAGHSDPGTGLDLQSTIIFESTKFKTQQKGANNNVDNNKNVTLESNNNAQGTGSKTEGSVARREAKRQMSSGGAAEVDNKEKKKLSEVDMAYVEELEDDLFELEDRCEALEKENKKFQKELSETEFRLEEFERKLEQMRIKYETVEERRQALEEENKKMISDLKKSRSVTPEARLQQLKSHDPLDVTKDKLVLVLREENKDLKNELDRSLEALREENEDLKCELEELRLEMEEMHDQFRDEEDVYAFRELQKELESTAKNCRILQFKLRKSDRKNEQLEAENHALDEKLRKLDSLFVSDEQLHLKELEDELKMAKEVSVRLHDELEFVEEKRQKYEDETEKLREKCKTSENERKDLGSQLERLQNEMERLRADLIEQVANQAATVPQKTTAPPTSSTQNISPVQAGTSRETLTHGDSSPSTTAVRPRAPMLTSSSRQSSTEHDVAQLMRDLSDSKERELDLKDQLRYAEEEIKGIRKKLIDLEEENETIVLQFRKMSRKDGRLTSDDESSEGEFDQRFQMELIEQEMNVLRRKNTDFEKANNNLQKEINHLQKRLNSREKEIKELIDSEPEGGLGRRNSLLTQEVENMKWRLIEKEREIEKLQKQAAISAKPHRLKKSKSLDYERELDIKKQLETVTKEANVLKEKLKLLENENDKLISDNNKLLLIAKRRVPAVSKDDPLVENMLLHDKVDHLEAANVHLNLQIKELEARLVTGNIGASGKDSTNMKEKLTSTEEELSKIKTQFKILEKDYKELYDEMKKNNERSRGSLATMNLDTLKKEIEDLDDEISELRNIVKSKDEENAVIKRELEEVKEKYDDLDFKLKHKEKSLLEEIEMLEQKNDILSNLLDSVNAAESEFESTSTCTESVTSPKSYARSISTCSDVSLGSDEVFSSEKNSTKTLNMERKFRLRIECLEKLLEEERCKVRAFEGATEADSILPLLGQKDKEVLRQEIAEFKIQLEDSEKNLRAAVDKISKLQITNEDLKEKLMTVSNELAYQTSKRKEETQLHITEEAAMEKERDELLKRLDNYKKKTENLYEELHDLQTLKSGKQSDNVEETSHELKSQLRTYKDDCARYKIRLEELQYKLQETTERYLSKEAGLEKVQTRYAVEKESAAEQMKTKEETIIRKNELLQQKETIISQKDQTIAANNETIAQKDILLRQKESGIRKLEASTKQRENEMTKMKDQVQQKEHINRQLEEKARHQSEILKQRDDKLREKEEGLREINKKFNENQHKIKEMEKNIERMTNVIKEKDNEIMKMHSRSIERSVALGYKDNLLQEHLDTEEELEKLKQVKETAVEELETLKKKINETASHRASLQTENQKMKDKLKVYELSKAFGESKSMKAILEEKEQLFVEKQKIKTEMEKYKNLKAETEKLQGLLDVKTAELEKEKALSDKLLMELTMANTQIKDVQTAMSDIQHKENSSKSTLDRKEKLWRQQKEALEKRLMRDEKLLEVEARTIKANFDSKVSSLQTEIHRLRAHAAHLKTEAETKTTAIIELENQIDILTGTHDAEIIKWNEIQRGLMRKINELDEHRRKNIELGRTIQELNTGLNEAESRNNGLLNKYTSDKSAWELQRIELQSRISELEEIARSISKEKQSKFKDFRAKLSTTSSSNDKEKADLKKTSENALSLVKDLQQQLKESEAKRHSEIKIAVTQHSKQELAWEVEHQELESRIAEMESRSHLYHHASLKLAHLEREFRIEKETWQQERGELQLCLEDTRSALDKERSKLDEIVTELLKLKDFTPLVEVLESPAEFKDLLYPYGTDEEWLKENFDLKKTLDDRLIHHFRKALVQLVKVTEDIQIYKEFTPKAQPESVLLKRLPQMEPSEYQNIPVYATTPRRPAISSTHRPSRSLSVDSPGAKPFGIGSETSLANADSLNSIASAPSRPLAQRSVSAHGSRSTSPDRTSLTGSVKKLTNYPDPTPGFAITGTSSTSPIIRTPSTEKLNSSGVGRFFKPLFKKAHSIETSSLGRFWKGSTQSMGSASNISTYSIDAPSDAGSEVSSDIKYLQTKMVQKSHLDSDTTSLGSTTSAASLARKQTRDNFFESYESRISQFNSMPRTKKTEKSEMPDESQSIKEKAESKKEEKDKDEKEAKQAKKTFTLRKPFSLKKEDKKQTKKDEKLESKKPEKSTKEVKKEVKFDVIDKKGTKFEGKMSEKTDDKSDVQKDTKTENSDAKSDTKDQKPQKANDKDDKKDSKGNKFTGAVKKVTPNFMFSTVRERTAMFGETKQTNSKQKPFGKTISKSQSVDAVMTSSSSATESEKSKPAEATPVSIASLTTSTTSTTSSGIPATRPKPLSGFALAKSKFK